MFEWIFFHRHHCEFLEFPLSGVLSLTVLWISMTAFLLWLVYSHSFSCDRLQFLQVLTFAVFSQHSWTRPKVTSCHSIFEWPWLPSVPWEAVMCIFVDILCAGWYQHRHWACPLYSLKLVNLSLSHYTLVHSTPQMACSTACAFRGPWNPFPWHLLSALGVVGHMIELSQTKYSPQGKEKKLSNLQFPTILYFKHGWNHLNES